MSLTKADILDAVASELRGPIYDNDQDLEVLAYLQTIRHDESVILENDLDSNTWLIRVEKL
jgi:hypothetical protein